jgi:hypothetical protein
MRRADDARHHARAWRAAARRIVPQRHTALLDVSSYPADTEVPWFRTRVVCAKCGARGNRIDVRPNWKEQPPHESLTGKIWR